ncbi:MAG: MBL fold metallo-hydrolase [Candidatus Methanoplasma sp.]|jgi:7,8-dihydropterin-6-yl-methyl-4-(beta-D-ribofuranosyl)aminobenzene 5'-phosphate synthase|nr:MBL fold metallo-hydrolase [Candidatus Methanoplasma sp.]
MKAKILCVYDEGSVPGTSLIGAKGISMLVEADGRKVLFDTGRRGEYLLHNLSFLDVKSEDVDTVVISQAGKDHSGGLKDLLKEREGTVDIYAPASIWGEKKLFGSSGAHIPADLEGKAAKHDVDRWTQISEHIFLSEPIGGETVLVIRTRKGPAVLSGRSVGGVRNIIAAVNDELGEKPKTYIGGVNIAKKESAKADDIAEAFRGSGCSSLYLNHCTGIEGMMYLRTNLGLKGVNDFYAGSVLELDL